MIINTTAAIPLNNRQVFVRVGSQEITSFEFQFEIFDCTGYITFPSLVLAQKFQIDGGIKLNNGSAISNSSECVIKSYGISINETIDKARLLQAQTNIDRRKGII